MKTAQWILGVAAGKGGVGKSSVAVNVALALKRLGYRVGILDADVYGPSVRNMLPEQVLPSQDTENSERIMPALAQGMPIISMAYFRKEGEAAIMRAPLANGAIQQFIHQVEWGELDVLVIDFPPGTGDIQLTLMQQGSLTAALIVTTPQEVALLDVRKAMQMFEAMQIPIVGIVENMSFFQDPISGARHYPLGKEGGKRLAAETGIDLMAQIPLDALVSECGDAGRVLFDEEQRSPAKEEFLKLAEQVIEQLRVIKPSGVFPVEIKQLTAQSVDIEWNDGKVDTILLCDVQKRCPCARCRIDVLTLDKQVEARQIEKIGQYALRFDFSSGCSKGLYPFSLLRHLK